MAIITNVKFTDAGNNPSSMEIDGEANAAQIIAQLQGLSYAVISGAETLEKTELTLTNTKTEPDGTAAEGGSVKRKAVITVKHIPASGEPTIHRFSIPAPKCGVDGGLAVVFGRNGKAIIPLTADAAVASTQKDGTELASIWKTLTGTADTVKFMSGVIHEN